MKCSRCFVGNCTECSTDIGTCERCEVNLAEPGTPPNFYLSMDNFSCLTTCPEKEYEAADLTCKPCLDNCQKCDNAAICNECLFTFYLSLDQTECKNFCDERSFRSGKICKDCPPGCIDCINEFNCNICEAGKFIDDSTKDCVTCDITNGKVVSDGTCKSCSSTCETCYDVAKNNCLTCPAGRSMTERNICMEGGLDPILVKETKFNEAKQIVTIIFD
jgi:hypothetical protein